MKPKDMANYSDHRGDSMEDKSYLVLDIGGGTVDVTALMHKHTDDEKNCFEVVIPPKGEESGGMNVNNNFMTFLATIVEDSKYERFLSKNCEKNYGSLTAIKKEFERLKVRFGDEATYPISEEYKEKSRHLLLDHNFVKFYGKKSIKKKLKGCTGVALHGDGYTLIINHSKMATFFEPVLEKIGQCAEGAIKKSDTKAIGAVCITGGFGGCRYVFSYLKPIVYRMFAGNEIPKMLVPLDHTIAVSQGAVHYGRNPEIITVRTADATYGTLIYVPFQEDRHVGKDFYLNCQKQKWCKDVFLPLVKQEERVKASNDYPVELSPVEPGQNGTTITFCRSTNPDVQYVDDENTEIIESINIPIAKDHKGKKELLIEMNFSSAEITAYVHAPGNAPKMYLTTMDYCT